MSYEATSPTKEWNDDGDSMDDPPQSKTVVAMKVVLVVTGLLAVFCMCFIALQAWKEVRSRERFSDDVNGRDAEVTCLVKGISAVQQTHNGFRSFITVEYVVNNTLLQSTCWSSHDGGFRSSEKEAERFLQKYGEIGSLQTCWYEPAVPLNVRLWNDKTTYIRNPLFWIACFYAVIWFAAISGYIVRRRLNSSDGTASHKQFELDNIKTAFSNPNPNQPSFKNALYADSDSFDDIDPSQHANSPPKQGTYVQIPQLAE